MEAVGDYSDAAIKLLPGNQARAMFARNESLRRSLVNPLALLVGSWKMLTLVPGAYFIQLLFWMSLDKR